MSNEDIIDGFITESACYLLLTIHFKQTSPSFLHDSPSLLGRRDGDM